MRALAPAGARILLTAGNAAPEPVLTSATGAQRAVLYASGTDALAACLSAARRLRGEGKVLLPAYGCPQLVSAAYAAGLVPVLVDLEPDRPWMSLESLRRQSEGVVAVVAVELFGIPERIDAIRQILGPGVVIVQDSAQAFPIDASSNFIRGDLVVVSFGRGKPVSLLTGGAVLVKRHPAAERLPTREDEVGGHAHALKWMLKAALYNVLISPRLYWLPARAPFLALGATRYAPFEDVPRVEAAFQRLAGNVERYRARIFDRQRMLQAMLAELAETGVDDLASRCGLPDWPLSRYPVLMPSMPARDETLRQLERDGLGATALYRHPLPEVTGIPEEIARQGPVPGARAFADRLLTLPVHTWLTRRDVARIRARLRDGAGV